jgi:hypothetical protein
METMTETTDVGEIQLNNASLPGIDLSVDQKYGIQAPFF